MEVGHHPAAGVAFAHAGWPCCPPGSTAWFPASRQTRRPPTQEYGCCKASDYAGKRGQVFAAFHDAADALGVAGTIVWQVVPWAGLKRDG